MGLAKSLEKKTFLYFQAGYSISLKAGITMKLCNGTRCLHSDTLIVLCYALFCICFGFTVALLVIYADKRRSKRAKISEGDEAVETTDGGKPLSRQQPELDEVHRTLTKLEDILDSPTFARRGSSASARLRQENKAKQATSPLAVENV